MLLNHSKQLFLDKKLNNKEISKNTSQTLQIFNVANIKNVKIARTSFYNKTKTFDLVNDNLK